MSMSRWSCRASWAATRALAQLPSSEGKHFQQALWRDSAKHEATSITVDRGVQLEVLDFGGQGSPIVLLAGLGATAHSYDELAPMLAQKHRVVAITRRGSGYSSRPDFGFDTPRLAQDVLQVMDALKLTRVLLVGHSIAGEELTWLGGHHPERFNGLVYLDAAYDRSGNAVMKSRQSVLSRSLPPEPPIPPDAMRNYQAMSALLAERGHVRLPEGELIAMWNVNKPFLAGMPGHGRANPAGHRRGDRSAELRGNQGTRAGYLRDSGSTQGVATLVRRERCGAEGDARGARPPQQRHAAQEHRTIPARRESRVRCWSCRTRLTT